MNRRRAAGAAMHQHGYKMRCPFWTNALSQEGKSMVRQPACASRDIPFFSDPACLALASAAFFPTVTKGRVSYAFFISGIGMSLLLLTANRAENAAKTKNFLIKHSGWIAARYSLKLLIACRR